ncbi:MAG: TetR family transcriptional regulator, partial [Rhodobacterales bacterium 17-64-5]
AEVARQGFDIFAALLEYAYDDGRPTPLAAFEATGRAYLAFARKYPGHYQAMFESGLQPGQHAALATVASKARGTMDRAAEQLSQSLAAERRPPASMISAHVWAVSHGVVELYLRGNGGPQPWAPEDLLESGIGIYLRGLGLLSPDR